MWSPYTSRIYTQTIAGIIRTLLSHIIFKNCGGIQSQIVVAVTTRMYRPVTTNGGIIWLQTGVPVTKLWLPPDKKSHV